MVRNAGYFLNPEVLKGLQRLAIRAFEDQRPGLTRTAQTPEPTVEPETAPSRHFD